MRILCRYRAGQLADMVFAVPLVELVPKVITDRIIETNHVRLHITAHIVVAGIDTAEAHLHRHALQRTVVYGSPVHIMITLVLILRIAHDAIVAELVVAI